VFAHRSASKVKAHIDPAIKAHLLRGAFYLLLLLAVCVIPFALAQRTTWRAPANIITVTKPADADSITNGNLTIVFHINASPVVQGQNTMHIPACAFNAATTPVTCL
jgi:hypothetical protein